MTAPKPHPNMSQWHSLGDAYENGLRDGRAEALEEAAKVAYDARKNWSGAAAAACESLAVAIRALKDKKP